MNPDEYDSSYLCRMYDSVRQRQRDPVTALNHIAADLAIDYVNGVIGGETPEAVILDRYLAVRDAQEVALGVVEHFDPEHAPGALSTAIDKAVRTHFVLAGQ